MYCNLNFSATLYNQKHTLNLLNNLWNICNEFNYSDVYLVTRKCNGPKSTSFQQNNFYGNPKRLNKYVCNILLAFTFTIESHEV